MNKLERYDIEEKDLPDSSYEQKMILISEGEWVKYEDVKALESDNAKLEDRIKDMLMGDDGQAWNEAEKFLEMQLVNRKLKELADENAALEAKAKG